MVQLSHPYLTTGKTIALTIWIFVTKVLSLFFNMLSRFVIAFLPRSKHLLISWLQLLSIVILKVKVTVTQSCPTLCNPRDCSLSGSSSMEFSRQEYWCGLPCPPPGDLLNPGIKTGSPALQADSLSFQPPGKPSLASQFSSVQFSHSVVSNSL